MRGNFGMPSETPSMSRANTSASPPAPEESRSKYRIRFAKSDDLRFLSHHDLMHVFERMFRRAALPLGTTHGFNPRPKLTFALSLALGLSGRAEVLEIELSQPLAADEIQARLRERCPPGLLIHGVRAIELRASARVRRALYALRLPTPFPDLPERCAELLTRTDCWHVRRRPHARRINLRPFIDTLTGQDDRVAMALWITPYGAARPEEIAAALGLHDALDQGAVIERVDLELMDEVPPGTSGPPEIRDALEEITTDDEPAPAAPRPAPLVGSPLSFET